MSPCAVQDDLGYDPTGVIIGLLKAGGRNL